MASRRDTTARRELLRRELSEACRSGALPPGQMVPALTELTAKYGLSNGVVHQEIKRLTEEGVLYTVPRVGTFVSTPASSAVSRPLPGADTIALLAPERLEATAAWTPSGWNIAIAHGAASAIHGSGFHVLSLHRSFFAKSRLTDNEVDRLISRGLLGLVVSDTHEVGDQLRQAFQERGLPVVAVDDNPLMGDCDRIITDHFLGAKLLTDWLLAQGRKRILNLWPESSGGYWFPARRQGYESALRDQGLSPMAPLQTAFGSAASLREFRDLANHLAQTLQAALKLSGPVDAIMLASDGYAPLTGAALKLLGLTPNEDVLLTGYDNYWRSMPYREFSSTRPLATIDKQNWETGRQAVELLLSRSRGELDSAWRKQLVAPQLAIAAKEDV